MNSEPRRSKISCLLKSLPQELTMLEQMGEFFNNIPKKEKKEQRTNYSKSPAKDDLASVLQKIDLAINNATVKGETYIPTVVYTQPADFFSCVEIDILKGLANLEIPMDFNYLISSEQLITKLLERIKYFFENEPRIARPVFSYALNALSKIDLDISTQLRACADDVINTVCKKALATRREQPNYWFFDDIICLLHGNAIHGLRPDGTYSSIIEWHTVKGILHHLENKLRSGKFKLNHHSAQQLFQIYAANYLTRDQFPAYLFENMNNFKTNIQSNSTTSEFESRVRLDFEFANGIYKKIEIHGFTRGNFNFKNPVTDFGMEADILFTDQGSDVKAVIQVDGDNYHTYACIDPLNRKNNLRTRFRDFCFAQAGYLSLNVTALNNNYSQQIVDFLEGPVLTQMNERQSYKKRLNNMVFESHDIRQKLNPARQIQAKNLISLYAESQRLPNSNMLNDIKKRLFSLAASDSYLHHDAATATAGHSTLGILRELNYRLSTLEKEVISYSTNILENYNSGMNLERAFNDDIAELDNLIEQYKNNNEIELYNKFFTTSEHLRGNIQTVLDKSFFTNNKNAAELSLELSNIESDINRLLQSQARDFQLYRAINILPPGHSRAHTPYFLAQQANNGAPRAPEYQAAPYLPPCSYGFPRK